MSGQFYVEASYWARWPKVLVMCKKTGNGTERRRYVPEGGTRDEWNERTREVMRKYSEAANKLNARMLEEQKASVLQAEIDGLRWAVEERDALILDMFAIIGVHEGHWRADGYFTAHENIERRMHELGIWNNDAHAERLRGEGEGE